MPNGWLSFKRYATMEELLAAHPNADMCQWGSVQKYNGREYVQVYHGQHDWIVISLEDPDEFHRVMEYDGAKEFGYVFVEADAGYVGRTYEEAVDWDVVPE